MIDVKSVIELVGVTLTIDIETARKLFVLCANINGPCPQGSNTQMTVRAGPATTNPSLRYNTQELRDVTDALYTALRLSLRG